MRFVHEFDHNRIKMRALPVRRLWMGMGIILAVAVGCVGAATAQEEESMQGPDGKKGDTPGITVIPEPCKVDVRKKGTFQLRPDTIIVADKGLSWEAEYLADALAPATGYELTVRTASDKAPGTNAIELRIDPALETLGDEGYLLSVEEDRLTIHAPKPAGVFYGIQTLRQLFPPEILNDSKASGVAWTAPCVRIEDKPRFAWRGQLFDCCRHFFDVDTVKRQIDLLALHKVNRLHWHLTEDQGWRIEIKQYPKLTEVGAWRIEKDGTKYGGFYTQDKIRDVVDYAAKRHILVVPEIEMPGHSTAALASYPELGCTGGPYKVVNTWGVFQDVYCAGNDKVFEFNQNVLDEVMGLFPSQYIHIGGDECPKDRWKECPKCQARIKAEGLKDEHELQSYFIKRIDTYLNSKGRRLIGWDEILEGGLAENAVVQSWRGTKGGIEAARQGHDVVMSPTSHCYLDYSYHTTPLEKSYSYEPIPEELTADEAKHVLGVEGNLWAERVPTRDRLDFQVFPRMTALAEVAWSPQDKRSWEDFSRRMETHTKRFEVLGVKFGYDEMGDIEANTTTLGTWTADQMKAEGVTLEWDVSNYVDAPGKYEALFLYTSGQAAVEIEWAALVENGIEVQRDTHDGWSGYDKRNVIYRFELKEFKKDAKYTVKAFLTPVGGLNSNGEVRMRKAE